MRRHNIVAAAVRCLLAMSCAMRLVAAELPSSCRHFQELLEQKGLNLTTRIVADPVFPAELLEPIVRVQNFGGKTLEIPVINRASGIFIDTFTRIEGIKPDTYRFDSGVHRDVAYMRTHELPFCSFQTTVLGPGEAKEFQIVYGTENLFLKVALPFEGGSFAARSEGVQRYAIHLGRTVIIGTYNVSPVTVEDVICVKKDLAPGKSDRPKASLIVSSDTCQMLTIVKSGSKVYLMSSVGPSSTESFKVAFQLAEGFKGRDRDRMLATESEQRIVELDSVASFGRREASSKPIDAADFKIVMPGDQSRLYLDDVSRMRVVQRENARVVK